MSMQTEKPRSRFADPPPVKVVELGLDPVTAAGGANPSQARAPKGTPIGGQWIDAVRGALNDAKDWLLDKGTGDRDEGEAGGGLVESVERDEERAALTLSEKKAKAIRGSYVSGDRINEAGDWTPEAIADQDAIIDGMFEGVAPAATDAEKVVYFSIGGPGSGKGSLFGKNRDQSGYPEVREIDDMTGIAVDGMPNPGAVLLDADSFKIQLKKVKEMRDTQRGSGVLNDVDGPGGNWASEAHEESSYMNKLAYSRALKKGLPIVFDGTGDGGVESVKEKIEEARRHGYTVKAAGMYLEPKEGLTRAISRAGGTGRNVPAKIQADTYADIVDTFNGSMKDGLFDSVTFLDNNGASKADKAKKIFEYTAGGGIRILDQAAWDKFQSSGSRLPDL
jgi:hypothetical protein